MPLLRWLVFLILLSPIGAMAQFSNVTATLVDSDSQAWNNCSWTGVLYSFGKTPTVNNVKLTQAQISQSGTCSGGGVLTGTFADVAFVAPGGSFWQMTICPNASAQCATFISPITGANPNLSAVWSLSLGRIHFPASFGAFGYQDAEIFPTPPPGGTYFNVTSALTRVWSGTTWVNIASGSGSGIASITWNLPSILTASPNPITANGTQTFSLAVQSAATFFAGPATGSPAAPTFRAIQASDIPTLNQSTTGSAGSVPFSGVTGGTNSTSAFVCGTGCNFSVSGTGVINATTVPITGVSGMGTNVPTFLTTPNSANLLAIVTDATGTGSAVFSASPTFTGTPLAPTPTANDNSTKIATTANVQAQRGGSQQASRVAGGPGAGTTPTLNSTGVDQAHQISVTAGSAPTANSVLVTVTFTNARPHAAFCTPWPANSAAQLLGLDVFVSTSNNMATYALSVGPTALASGTTYLWNVSCP